MLFEGWANTASNTLRRARKGARRSRLGPRRFPAVVGCFRLAELDGTPKRWAGKKPPMQKNTRRAKPRVIAIMRWQDRRAALKLAQVELPLASGAHIVDDGARPTHGRRSTDGRIDCRSGGLTVAVGERGGRTVGS